MRQDVAANQTRPNIENEPLDKACFGELGLLHLKYIFNWDIEVMETLHSNTLSMDYVGLVKALLFSNQVFFV
jgi:hypothetical protein